MTKITLTLYDGSRLMRETNKKGISPGWAVVLIIMGLTDLALLIRRFTEGKNMALFNPQGWVAQEQHGLLVLSMMLLFLVSIPVIGVLYFFAWKYRESNTKAKHSPGARQSKSFVFGIWAFPFLVFILFTTIMIPATHKLEPRKQIDASAEPLTIQVIAMRWKWVFLYPDQKIATVNHVQIPKDTPIRFELTADEAPMSSFWVPNLSGQLYAMTSHVNQLNLIADTVGSYRGSSAEINGPGFAGMTFTANVSMQEDFDHWVQEAKQSGTMLDTTAYEELVKPSEDNPQATYANFQDGLYDTVLMKYSGSHEMHQTNNNHQEHAE